MPPSFDASGTSNAIFDELADESLARTTHTYARLAIIIHCKTLALVFKFVIGILRNWVPFVIQGEIATIILISASGISNAMFDELVGMSLIITPLVGTKHSNVRHHKYSL